MKTEGEVFDFSWHVGYAKMEEGDKRRHKARCVFYVNKEKRCLLRFNRCGGSSHCKDYSEDEKDLAKVGDQTGTHPFFTGNNTTFSTKKPAKAKPKQTQSSKTAYSFLIGKTVSHKKYGQGIVASVTETHITVKFQYLTKHFPISALLDGKVTINTQNHQSR